MKKLLTLFSFLAVVFAARAQNGDISGKVSDENGDGIPFANVALVDGKGIPTGRGTQTDFDGKYSISPLTPGNYNIQFSYVGYAAQLIQGVVVNDEKSTFIDIKLKPSSKELKAVEIVSYKVPLIDPGNTTVTNVVSATEIANMSTKNVSDIAATTAGVFQSDQGGSLNIRGGREDGTQYYVDGIKVIGTPNIPASSIEQLQVVTGGVAAEYGDLTGGLVNITTKGPSTEFHGSLEVQTSQGLDAFGSNLVDGSLEGPIWKEKATQKTIMGFFASAEYQHQDNNNPSAIGLWQVRPSLLDSLNASPLQKAPNGFELTSTNVTMADMYKQLTEPNTPETDIRGNLRLDIRPADNITLSFGGSVSESQVNEFVYGYSLFNSVNNPSDNQLNYRFYGRFTQNIQSKQSEEDAKDGKKRKSSAFQNAYYSIQADYEKSKQHVQGAGGTNPFDYGYIGKFDTKTAPIFQYDTFAIGNKVYQGWKQIGIQDTAVAYTPSKINPNSSAYTTEYYQLLGAQTNQDGSLEVYNNNNAAYTANVTDIAANQGLINGSRSNFVNNIWYNTGRAYGAYGNYQYSSDASLPGGGNSDQYHVRLEGAFDILKPGAPSRNKHSFKFGIEYEQRIERNYQMFPLLGNGLWSLARSLVNNQLQDFDYNNPIFRINGNNYAYNDPNRPNFYLTDTILFNPVYQASQQSYFDQQVRKALGWAQNSLSLINIDNLSPSFLNVKMFSPDELLGNSGVGSQYVTYRGYDAYGDVLTTQPSFDDFFTQKDANGNYTRLIPAYRPIYTDAYIQDRFFFKDLAFNVGVRFDRFDANQEELIDPYTLYPVKTAGEVTEIDGTPVNRPADIGSNAAVYVDNSAAPTTVVGYRSGSTWYDRYGNQLASGASVASASSTGTIQPYLVNANENIQSPNFDPNQSFQQYKPDIIVMPRLQFSFSLTDKALFFAHYDILSQRPNDQQIAMDPTQYYFLVNNIGSIVNNPALEPSRTVDYELGFKQRVSNTAAFTISAFYREFRDQVDITKITSAYPTDYITYGNIDFGTTKGVMLDFDMRRTGNFSLKANYTLQFADGTGSDPQTQLNLVNANSPNLRSISPLNYDSRHLINVNVTYSYGVGKDYNGPIIKNKQIFSDAGITLQLSTRSGTPYTAQENVTPTALQSSAARAVGEGSINGSRLPWYFRFNLRVFKNFDFTVGGKKNKKEGKGHDVGLQIYLYIQNLLNTQNVLTVYRYTGVANTDGYLNDPASLSAIESALNPRAFKDQYAVYVDNPANYSLPRRIYLGGVFTF